MPLKVRKTAEMTPEDFANHINFRHTEDEELGGLAEVSEFGAERNRAVWEAYHERLHKTREYHHEH